MTPSELDGDLNEWGDGIIGYVKGLSPLGVSGIACFKDGYKGFLRPPTPEYWPKSRLCRLNNEISVLNQEYIIILANHYIEKKSYNEIAKELGIGKTTAWDKATEAKNILLDSKYWIDTTER